MNWLFCAYHVPVRNCCVTIGITRHSSSNNPTTVATLIASVRVCVFRSVFTKIVLMFNDTIVFVVLLLNFSWIWGVCLVIFSI